MRITLRLFLFLFLFSGIRISAQQNKIDSLKNVLKSSKEDTNKVNALNKLCNLYSLKLSYDSAYNYGYQALKLAETINFKKGIVQADVVLAKMEVQQSNYSDGMDTFIKALQIADSINYQKGSADAYMGIGLIYYYQNNYQPSLDNLFKSLKIREDMNDQKGLTYCYTNIGVDYESLNKFELALEYFFKSLKMSEALNDEKGIAICQGNIGSIYYLDAKSIKNKMSSPETVGRDSLLKLALDYCLKSLALEEKINYKLGLPGNYGNIGNIYLLMGDENKSFYYLEKDLTVSQQLKAYDNVMDAYSYLSDYFENIGDEKSALHYLQEYTELRDSLISDRQAQLMAELNTKYETAKKNKELLEKDHKINEQRSAATRKKIYLAILIGGIISLLAISIVFYRSNRSKKIINAELDRRNKNITDSINYANRIQNAILPAQNIIEKSLPESFIFYKPKDIVSGDFYWFNEIGNKIILAVGDCTGHGVPGAFMSMIGNTLLNEIVNTKNIFDPHLILEEMNKGIVHVFSQQGKQENTQEDGMDISVITIDKKKNEILFAGANHAIDVIADGKHEVLSGDIYSIGGMFGKKEIQFSNKIIAMKKGMCIYLSTDGFQDQFGGEKNSKFLSSRFEKLLVEIYSLPMKEQKMKLTEVFENWKGRNEQLDDLLVIGIKI